MSLKIKCLLTICVTGTVTFAIYTANRAVDFFSAVTMQAAKLPLTFEVEPSDLVGMTISDTSRYGLSDEGHLDYAALMPSGGHIVQLSSEDATVPVPYTVSLFHQLKCLEIYHSEYLKPTPRAVTSELQGCLNYLRQSLLCHANTRLESIKNSAIQAEKQYDTVCRDWTKVYEAAEKNNREYISVRERP